MIKEWIASNRSRIERDLLDSDQRRFYSPAYYSQYQVTLPLIQQYAKGRLIDLGCGNMPYKKLIADRVSAYDGLDFYPRTAEVMYISDIQNMPTVKTESYDTAICLEVLEHVPDPFQAAREIYRVLKPDGTLILSVPHLNRLHEVPHDYYRYTAYGVRQLLESSGFKVLLLEKRGGLFCFLGHQLSTFWLGLTWRIPIVRSVIWFINRWLITRGCYGLDRLVDGSGIYAMGYTAVAVKPRA